MKLTEAEKKARRALTLKKHRAALKTMRQPKIDVGKAPFGTVVSGEGSTAAVRLMVIGHSDEWNDAWATVLHDPNGTFGGSAVAAIIGEWWLVSEA